jgi:hypothetical protein
MQDYCTSTYKLIQQKKMTIFSSIYLNFNQFILSFYNKKNL